MAFTFQDQDEQITRAIDLRDAMNTTEFDPVEQQSWAGTLMMQYIKESSGVSFDITGDMLNGGKPWKTEADRLKGIKAYFQNPNAEEVMSPEEVAARDIEVKWQVDRRDPHLKQNPEAMARARKAYEDAMLAEAEKNPKVGTTWAQRNVAGPVSRALDAIASADPYNFSLDLKDEELGFLDDEDAEAVKGLVQRRRGFEAFATQNQHPWSEAVASPYADKREVVEEEGRVLSDTTMPNPYTVEGDFAEVKRLREKVERRKKIREYQNAISEQSRLRNYLAVRPTLSPQSQELCDDYFGQNPREGATPFTGAEVLDARERREAGIFTYDLPDRLIAIEDRNERNLVASIIFQNQKASGWELATRFGDTMRNIVGSVGNEVADIVSRMAMTSDEYQEFAEQRAALSAAIKYNPQRKGFWTDAAVDAVAMIPYMATAGIHYAGIPMMAMQCAEEMQDRVAQAGGDVTGLDFISQKYATAFAYAFVERLQWEALGGMFNGAGKEISREALKIDLAKGIWTRLGTGMVTGTLTESAEEGIQAAIEEAFVQYRLNGYIPSRDVTNAAIRDFAESIAPMLLTSAFGAGKQLLTQRGSIDPNAVTALVQIADDIVERAQRGDPMDMDEFRNTLGQIARGWVARHGEQGTGMQYLLNLGLGKDEAAKVGRAIDSAYKAITARTVEGEVQRMRDEGEIDDSTTDEAANAKAQAKIDQLLYDFYGGREALATDAVVKQFFGGALQLVHGEDGSLSLVLPEADGRPERKATIVRAESAITPDKLDDKGENYQPGLDEEVLDFVNRGRQRNGLAPLTKEEWKNTSPENKAAAAAAEGLKVEGFTIATDGGAEITLTRDARQWTLGHEGAHAFVAFLRQIGLVTPEVAKELRRKFGDPRIGKNEEFDEENFVNQFVKAQSGNINYFRKSFGDKAADFANAVRRRLGFLFRAIDRDAAVRELRKDAFIGAIASGDLSKLAALGQRRDNRTGTPAPSATSSAAPAAATEEATPSTAPAPARTWRDTTPDGTEIVGEVAVIDVEDIKRPRGEVEAEKLTDAQMQSLVASLATADPKDIHLKVDADGVLQSPEWLLDGIVRAWDLGLGDRMAEAAGAEAEGKARPIVVERMDASTSEEDKAKARRMYADTIPVNAQEADEVAQPKEEEAAPAQPTEAEQRLANLEAQLAATPEAYEAKRKRLMRRIENARAAVEQEMSEVEEAAPTERYSISAVTPEEDAAYMDAVRNGDMETEQRMVREAAAKKMKNPSPLTFHGTRNWGFTTFNPGVIFTSDDVGQARGYGTTDASSAQPRPLWVDDLPIGDAQSVAEAVNMHLGNSNFRVMRPEEKAEYFDRIAKLQSDFNARVMSETSAHPGWEDALLEIANDGEQIDAEIWDALATLNFASDIGKTGDEVFESGEADEDSARASAQFTGEAYQEYKNEIKRIDDFYEKHRDEIDNKKLGWIFDLVSSYQRGDLAIDNSTLATMLTGDEMLISKDRDGNPQYDNYWRAEDARKWLRQERETGTYSLYADMGDNPFVVEGNGAYWTSIKVDAWDGMHHDTNEIAAWAIENGYTSVLFKDIIDPSRYGVSRAGNVRAIFGANNVKSADPVTYDDAGNVIPLSERFNEANPDIRYSIASLGVPYQGSKGRIAEDIVSDLPPGNRFVDLFSGGGAMTHAAMLSGKYGSYRMNDINPVGQDLFLQGMRGEWDDYSRDSMTEEEFAQIRGTPESLVWSFNGLGRNLAKGERGELNARANVARVRRVGALGELADQVEPTAVDYRDVELEPGDVVYADIPYEGTDQTAYGNGKFDKAAFVEWAMKQPVPIYVSEYSMPSGWTEVNAYPIRGMAGAATTERLWVQDKFAADPQKDAMLGADTQVETPDGTRYSIRSLRYDLDNSSMLDDLVEHGIMTRAEADVFRERLEHLIDLIIPNAFILDINEEFDKENRPFKPFKPNSDPLYKISLDFSTLCKKRIFTQYVIEQLQLQYDRVLSAEEQLRIREKLKEYTQREKNLQVACGICYVEAARLKSPKQIAKYFADPGAVVRNYFAKANKEFEAKVKAMQAEYKVSLGLPADATKDDIKEAKGTSAVTELNKRSSAMRQSYKPSKEELATIARAEKLPRSTFLTADNLTKLAVEEPDIYGAYSSFVRESTHSKGLETDVPYYYGDTRNTLSDKFVKQMNEQGTGMRHQSWSDFQMRHLLDTIVAISDLSVRGAKMHAYTKVVEFAKIFGRTGVMINLSLIPEVDGEGFSPTEGMDYEAAKELRDRFPETTGTIAIGISDEHVIKLLDDPAVDYVIPYHISGLNKSLRKIVGIHNWNDFTARQHEKKEEGRKKPEDMPSELWHKEPEQGEWIIRDNSADGYEVMRRSAERYLQLCHERGLVPKFAGVKGLLERTPTGWRMLNQNYWKLLIDHKMVNQKTNKLIEQQAVRPDFDFDEMEQLIRNEVANYDPTQFDRGLQYVRETMGKELDKASAAAKLSNPLPKKPPKRKTRYSIAADLDYSGDSYVASIAASDILAGRVRDTRDYEELSKILGATESVENIMAEAKDYVANHKGAVAKKLIDQGRYDAAVHEVAGQVELAKKVTKAVERGVGIGMKIGNRLSRRGGEGSAKAYREIHEATHALGGAKMASLVAGVDIVKLVEATADDSIAKTPDGKPRTKKAKSADDGKEEVEKTVLSTEAIEAAIAEWKGVEEPAEETETEEEEAEEGESAPDERARPATPAEFFAGRGIDVYSPTDLVGIIGILVRDWIISNSQGKYTKENVFRSEMNVKVYQDTMATILTDLSKAMVDNANGGAIRRIVNAINGISAYVGSTRMTKDGQSISVRHIDALAAGVVRAIQSDAITTKQRSLIGNLRKDLKKLAGSTKHLDKLEEDIRSKLFKDDLTFVRFVSRVVGWTPGRVQTEREKLEDILDNLGHDYTEAGRDRADANDNEVFRAASLRLSILNEYGGLRYRTRAEITEKARQLVDEIKNKLELHAAKWQAEEKDAEDHREMLARLGGPRQGENRHGEYKSWFWRQLRKRGNQLVCTLRQRLDLFMAKPDMTEAEEKDAKEVESWVMRLVSEGSQERANLNYQYANGLNDAIRNAIEGSGMTARQFLEHLGEQIPDDLSRQITRDGNAGASALTWGQLLNIYAYLCQTSSYAENIHKHGRDGQKELIEQHLTIADIKFVENLRALYSARREALSQASMDIIGRPINEPDPLYMPVRMRMDPRGGLTPDVFGGWSPVVKALFSTRVRSDRDVDERQDILALYRESSDSAATAIAFGRRGLSLRSALTHKDVVAALEYSHGKAEVSAFLHQLSDTLNGQPPDLRTDVGILMRWLNSAATYTSLAWNPFSPFKQLTSMPAWSGVLDAEEYGKVLRYALEGAWNADARAAMSELLAAPGFVARYGTEHLGSIKAIQEIFSDPNPKQNLVKKLFAAGLQGLQIADLIPGLLIGQGVYRTRVARFVDQEGMSVDDAKRRAAVETWALIEESQQSDKMQNLMEDMRRGGVLAKSLYKFATSPVLQASQEVQAFRIARRSGWRRDLTMKALNVGIANHVLMPAALYLVNVAIRALTRDDDPFKDWWKEALLMSIIGSYAKWLFFGSCTETFIRASMGLRTYNNMNLPAGEMAYRVWTKGGATMHDVFGLDGDAIVDDLIDLAGALSPAARYGTKLLGLEKQPGPTRDDYVRNR